MLAQHSGADGRGTALTAGPSHANRHPRRRGDVAVGGCEPSEFFAGIEPGTGVVHPPENDTVGHGRDSGRADDVMRCDGTANGAGLAAQLGPSPVARRFTAGHGLVGAAEAGGPVSAPGERRGC